MNELDDFCGPTHPGRMRVAVVGGGVSGLVAAYRLAARHDVTLIEAAPTVGGHVATVDVDWKGERHAVDPGFIVFNDRNYPRFVRLLAELGVASQPTTMGFSVRCDAENLEYSGATFWSLFAQRRNWVRPRFWMLLCEIVRFHRAGARGLDNDLPETETVADFLASHRLSRDFADLYLLPMGSALWSCPLATFASFPMRFVLEFFRNHGLLAVSDIPQWRVIAGGSRTYVEALLKRFRGDVRVNSTVRRITRRPDAVMVEARDGTAERFDHAVIACHADQALRLLDDPTTVERQTLAAFPYQINRAAMHTDVSVLPRRRRAWASWNYRVDNRSVGTATVTYCMNILQRIESRHTFCVTLNGDAIDPAKVIREFEFHHPVFTVGRAEAHRRHGELTNANRTSFCGAYWGNGFHEDGVASAEAVVEAIERTAAHERRPETAAP